MLNINVTGPTSFLFNPKEPGLFGQLNTFTLLDDKNQTKEFGLRVFIIFFFNICKNILVPPRRRFDQKTHEI